VYRKNTEWLWIALLFLSACLLSAEARAAVSDPWVDAGWRTLEQNGGSEQQKLSAAIGLWQRGVDQLPPDQVLLSPIGLFSSSIKALRGAQRLGPALRGIVLKGHYHGTIRYFVLAVPPAGGLEPFRAHFEQLISGGQRRVYGWEASRFQHGGLMALSAGSQTMPQDSAALSKPKGGMAVRAKPPRKRATLEQLAQKLLEMAREAREQGDRKRAILLLTELLKRTPDHARARLMSGRLMVEDGQYNAAWQVMRPLLKAESLNWKPWFWSGTAELMAGRLDEAANQFDEALARDGTVAAVWVQRALVAQERERYAVAYQLLKVAEAQSPKSVQVILNIGFTLDAMGKTEAASAYYRRYLTQTAGATAQWKGRKAVIVRLVELSR